MRTAANSYIRDTIPKTHFRFSRISGTQIRSENTRSVCSAVLQWMRFLCAIQSIVGCHACRKQDDTVFECKRDRRAVNRVGLTVIVTDAQEIYTFPFTYENSGEVSCNNDHHECASDTFIIIIAIRMRRETTTKYILNYILRWWWSKGPPWILNIFPKQKRKASDAPVEKLLLDYVSESDSGTAHVVSVASVKSVWVFF